MSRHDTVLGAITGWFSMPGYVRIGVPSDFIHSGAVADALSASYANTVFASVATNTTLCFAPLIVRFGR
jgi:hypothetical protein